MSYSSSGCHSPTVRAPDGGRQQPKTKAARVAPAVAQCCASDAGQASPPSHEEDDGHLHGGLVDGSMLFSGKHHDTVPLHKKYVVLTETTVFRNESGSLNGDRAEASLQPGDTFLATERIELEGGKTFVLHPAGWVATWDHNNPVLKELAGSDFANFVLKHRRTDGGVTYARKKKFEAELQDMKTSDLLETAEEFGID